MLSKKRNNNKKMQLKISQYKSIVKSKTKLIYDMVETLHWCGPIWFE